MKYYVLILLCLGCCTILAQPTIYLTRHAEQEAQGSDPHLSAEGKQRAIDLLNTIAAGQITALYATDFNRTKETLAPFVNRYGLDVQIYDYTDLSGFAEKLKSMTGNIVVAGHSNTTPQLAHLLSGEPVYGIDESCYDNLFIVQFSEDQSCLSQVKYGRINHPLDKTEAFPVDLSSLPRKQILTYNMLFQGQVAGKTNWSYVQETGTLTIRDDYVLEKYQVDVRSFIKIDLETGKPLSAEMKGLFFGGEEDITAHWDDEGLTGKSLITRGPTLPEGTIDLTQSISPLTIERTTAIMLAANFDLTQVPFQFQWINLYDNDKRPIGVTVEDYGEVTVPAGTFDALKVSYSGGNPSQVFYITKGEKRKIVKIEIPGQPWEYQLVKVE